MAVTALILPGIGNSGPEHWQTLWEVRDPTFVRVQQRDWDFPVCNDWMDALEHAVQPLDANVVLVAHSLGCLLVARWASQTKQRVKAALLVAPPDPSGPQFPKEAQGFSIPSQELPFPSVLVASTNDPYASFEFCRSTANTWGSRLVSVGPAGHINSSSGLGEWTEGLSLLRQLMA